MCTAQPRQARCPVWHLLLHACQHSTAWQFKCCCGLQVATAVAEEAFAEGIAQIDKPKDLEAYLADRMWLPDNPLEAPNHFSSLKSSRK